MRKITTAAVAGVLIVPAAGSSVGAATDTKSVVATYDGRKINLADGWQGAHACVVYSTADVRCYDSETDIPDKLVAAARQAPAAGTVTAMACGGGGAVSLYTDTGFGGDVLRFATTNSAWQNLAPYGFDNDMESWQNSTGCNAFVSDGTNGSGDHLTLGSNSSSSNVGLSWKNRASSVNVA